MLAILGTSAEETAAELQNGRPGMAVSVAELQAFANLFWAPSMTPLQIGAWLEALPADAYPMHRLARTSAMSEVRAHLGLSCAVDPVAESDRVVAMTMGALRRVMRVYLLAVPDADPALTRKAQAWSGQVARQISLASHLRRTEGRPAAEERAQILRDLEKELRQSQPGAAGPPALRVTSRP